jgi:hypothetical protein
MNQQTSELKTIEASLSKLVEDSNLILKVKFVSVFKESVPITDKQKDPSNTYIPPFMKQGCTFQVLSVLKNTARMEVPESVEVPNENWRRLLSKHKEKFAGGSNKSYNVPIYITEVPSLKKATIIFLNYFQGMFDLTAIDAFENEEGEEKVKMLLGTEDR